MIGGGGGGGRVSVQCTNTATLGSKVPTLTAFGGYGHQAADDLSPHRNWDTGWDNADQSWHGGGACGYNCSLLRPNATDKLMGCTKADFGKCRVYCDSRAFPNANATARARP